ncbi:MAG: benzoyl-CoA 2,3-epoxidase subunit BoxB [Planctomycetes bacterium]|nr:benzoyl-CoA 2,3-epoxidase subunit BoxB [Planctomycetota bacterium]
MAISYEKIPNNVDLENDPKLQRALEQWQPNFLQWWKETGPQGFDGDLIYLRTAVSVEPNGWAHFDYVKMKDYKWGIFLVPPEKERVIPFGDDYGKPIWNEIPGAFRKELRRIIVTQGDTEPASVEQQKLLGKTAPSLYDLRNLFQVNVEEGRHLWAMVYLLHKFFGKDGREEAEDLLTRRSGHSDSPRMLGAFNKPVNDWLAFFCFTTFTDRDGKYQLGALAESAFDPLARSTQFMLTEEAHHLFVGETGVRRVIERAAQLMKEHKTDDVTKYGGISLDVIQKYINEWYSSSLDLFGSEDSSNSANYFANGLKGRWHESKDKSITDHIALEDGAGIEVFDNEGNKKRQTIPVRRAMNLFLRNSYMEDCDRVLERWNKVLEDEAIHYQMTLPSDRFNRAQGIYGNMPFDPEGNLLTREEYDKCVGKFLPTESDYKYVQSLMKPVYELGKIAGWIAPPLRGINGNPFEFAYVKFSHDK